MSLQCHIPPQFTVFISVGEFSCCHLMVETMCWGKLFMTPTLQNSTGIILYLQIMYKVTFIKEICVMVEQTVPTDRIKTQKQEHMLNDKGLLNPCTVQKEDKNNSYH